jgi:hypothetical protein
MSSGGLPIHKQAKAEYVKLRLVSPINYSLQRFNIALETRQANYAS